MSLKANRWLSLIGFGLVAIVLFTINKGFYLDMLIMTLFWGLLGMAWNVAGGYAGQFSVGNAAFLGIGAYTSTLLHLKLGLNPWIGMFVGGVAAAAIAAVLGAICVRLKGYFFSLATIAFGQIMFIIVIQLLNFTRGSMGISIPFQGGPAEMIFSNPQWYGLLILGLTGLTYYLLQWLEHSKLGYYLLALRENEDAARSLGVHNVQIRVIALAISAFITAIAGAFYARYMLFIDPPSVFGLPISIQIALIAIIGGVGTLLGPLIGALLVIPLGLFLRASVSSIGGFDLMMFGLIMVIVVLFFPKGLLFYLHKYLSKAWNGFGKQKAWKQS